MIDTCLRKILIDRDVIGAQEYVPLAGEGGFGSELCVRARRLTEPILLPFSYTKQIIADLLQNKIDMAQLVITKALSKTGKDCYAS